MLKSPYDWDDIRVFLSVYEMRSFSAAARELGISQPTVGRRIKSLEDGLKNRLFERLSEGLSPTEAGVMLASKAFPMAEAAETLNRQSTLLAADSVGTVRVSMNEQAGMLLSKHVHHIRKTLPGIELELITTHVEASLSRREADLLIRFCKPKQGNLYTQKLTEMPFAVFASRASDVAPLPQEEDLGAWLWQKDLPWVGWDEEHAYQPDATWMRSTLKMVTPVIRINHAMMMQTMLRENLGVGLLPSAAGDHDIQLKRLTPDIPGLVSNLYLIVHGDLRFVPAIRSVMNELLKIFKTAHVIN
ncbi:LysR family transcriptional regulator [Kiloniella majae]|uniref:LysR family transcriptional regulator n=1 Tax=Kiloniella majae TaxID=1938558 RepID=UPI000A2782FB|nr:LysR family transcriptional regulator [Kiloniella majae]